MAKRISKQPVVTQKMLSDYRKELDTVGKNAEKYVRALMDEFMREHPETSVAEIREAAINAIDESLNAFGDQAADLAGTLFDSIVEAQGIDAKFLLEDAIDRKSVDKTVHYYAKKLVDGDVEGFNENILSLTKFCIKRNALENLQRNAQRNDLRYARVPSGRETCGFCFMLSSRGFVYHSEKTAGNGVHYHKNCQCVIVPGYRDKDKKLGIQIEGYDPDGMLERYHSCLNSIGGEEQLWEEFEKLSPEEKARFAKRKNTQALFSRTNSEKYGESASAFNNYLVDRLTKEIETRDFRWLNTGELPRVDWSLRSKTEMEPKEVKAIKILSENGFIISTNTERSNAKANIDIQIGNKDWELKNLTSNKKVEARISEARSKWYRLGMDKNNCRVVLSSFGSTADEENLIEEIKRRSWKAKEVLYIKRDGTGVIRIKK